MHDAELVVQEAQRWLRFAAEDLEAARRLLAVRSSAPRVEGGPGARGVRFPTHDLNALRNLLPDSWPAQADLAELTGWAVQARYPGEWPEPSAADAVRAESEARAVHNAIEAEFRCRGLYAGVK